MVLHLSCQKCPRSFLPTTSCNEETIHPNVTRCPNEIIKYSSAIKYERIQAMFDSFHFGVFVAACVCVCNDLVINYRCRKCTEPEKLVKYMIAVLEVCLCVRIGACSCVFRRSRLNELRFDSIVCALRLHKWHMAIAENIAGGSTFGSKELELDDTGICRMSKMNGTIASLYSPPSCTRNEEIPINIE